MKSTVNFENCNNFRKHLKENYKLYYELECDYSFDFENRTYYKGKHECSYQQIINFILYCRRFDTEVRSDYAFNLAFCENIVELKNICDSFNNLNKQINFKWYYISKNELVKNEINFYNDKDNLFDNYIKNNIIELENEIKNNDNIEKIIYDFYQKFLKSKASI